jgi:phosphoribosylglycinamide formyltransferase-1
LRRFAVFCSGNGSNFDAIAAAAARGRLGKAEIALMVGDNPKAFAIRRAARRGIPVVVLSPKLFPSRRDWERLILRVLRLERVDFVVLAGFMRILTPTFIRAYRGRILNIHPSYLPEFKGAHAIRDAFEARVRRTGVSVHIVTAKLDSGPVLARRRVPVRPFDTIAALESRIHAVEHKLYPAAIARFARRLPRR